MGLNASFCQGLSPPVPPPSNISPVCSRSKAMVGILNSTKALRPENGCFFRGCQSQLGGPHCWVLLLALVYCTWLEKYGSNDFETEKTWKNIMSLKKNVCLRSSKNLLGNRKKLEDLTVSRCSQPIPRMLVVGNVVTWPEIGIWRAMTCQNPCWVWVKTIQNPGAPKFKTTSTPK